MSETEISLRGRIHELEQHMRDGGYDRLLAMVAATEKVVAAARNIYSAGMKVTGFGTHAIIEIIEMDKPGPLMDAVAALSETATKEQK